MIPPNRRAILLSAPASLVMALVLFSPNALGQDGGWSVIRADYGFRAQRNDVTGLVRDLLARGGMNGRIFVNNQNMGGDPAPGADKVLRIFARDNRSQDHEFDYNEGGIVPVGLFVVRVEDHGVRDDHHDDRDRFVEGGDHEDRSSLSIVSGFYGVQGRMVSVTDLLQHMVRNGSLAVVANNASMGGDPAPGGNKLLIVFYQYHGKEQAMAASEGHMLSLP